MTLKQPHSEQERFKQLIRNMRLASEAGTEGRPKYVVMPLQEARWREHYGDEWFDAHCVVSRKIPTK